MSNTRRALAAVVLALATLGITGVAGAATAGDPQVGTEPVQVSSGHWDW
ncbi:hypothetical protein V5D56_11010 [Cellulosimicrobium sp. PMB13]